MNRTHMKTAERVLSALWSMPLGNGEIALNAWIEPYEHTIQKYKNWTK